MRNLIEQAVMPSLIEQAVATLTNTLAYSVRTAADVLGVDPQELYRQVCTHAAKGMPDALGPTQNRRF
jgi:hypothetical protein